ncbi:hypothetical protein QDR63_18775 [Acinetobacter baumannii]|uniref:type III toxin-antitoxin system TenpIN family toxin n=1 Tax=Acinetobacter TaxID=469 RepID=UPI001C553B68|nr:MULTISPECIES: hypothetical protein [Acinetobacter]MDH2528304.1 hypothetical protein [Acinetobacter baumannii]
MAKEMFIQKLDETFFNENNHLVEVLDKREGKWDGEKERGYGILVIEIKSLRFGIPLRSHMNHKQGFFTKGTKGLDYSKAVLLAKDEYISAMPFKIPSDEYVKVKDRSRFIEKKFTKYVEDYIRGVSSNDQNILRPYRFSTLQNYHVELGLE